MSNLKSRLLDKIHSKNAVIGIVGLGYVGLPLSLRYAEAGYQRPRLRHRRRARSSA